MPAASVSIVASYFPLAMSAHFKTVPLSMMTFQSKYMYLPWSLDQYSYAPGNRWSNAYDSLSKSISRPTSDSNASCADQCWTSV